MAGPWQNFSLKWLEQGINASGIWTQNKITPLIGGIVTLCFTVAHIIRVHSEKDEEGEGEEMERLAGDLIIKAGS